MRLFRAEKGYIERMEQLPLDTSITREAVQLLGYREVFLIHVYCGASLGHGKRACSETSPSSPSRQIRFKRSGCPCRHYLPGGRSIMAENGGCIWWRAFQNTRGRYTGRTSKQAAREQCRCRSAAAVGYLVSSWSRESLVDDSTNTTPSGNAKPTHALA